MQSSWRNRWNTTSKNESVISVEVKARSENNEAIPVMTKDSNNNYLGGNNSIFDSGKNNVSETALRAYSSEMEKVNRGTDGDDNLYGSGIFDGGKGNDIITVNGSESSTLRFNLGDGQDVVRGCIQNKGTIQFGPDVTPEMISFSRNQTGLVIHVGNNGDQITITDYFSYADTNVAFTRFEFANNTVWSDFRETAQWTNSDLTLVNYGGRGHDMMSGSGIFVGGKGDDTIYISNPASSTLRFNLGDGQDFVEAWGQGGTIEFGPDVTPEMISFVRDSKDGLVIQVGQDGDRITLDRYFYTYAYGNRENFTRFEFTDANGKKTVWSDFRKTDVWANSDLTPINLGTNENDTLTSLAGGILEGGKGNDSIRIFSNEASTLRFNVGDGKDDVWVIKGSESDKVVFGPDVTPDMITFSRDVTNLIVHVGDKGDQMTFGPFFDNQENQTFTTFEFADGTVWNDIRSTDAWKSAGLSHETTNTTCLLNNQVDNLISSMSAFSPSQGSISQPVDYSASQAGSMNLAPVA